MAPVFYSSRADFDVPPQAAQEKKHRGARWTKIIPKRNKRRSSSLFSHGGCVECPLWIKSGHLVLLEKESDGVRKQRERPEMHSGPWVLRSPAGSSVSSHDTPTAFIVALRRAMTEAKDIELLYDLWEKNIETLRTVHRFSKEEPGIVPKLVAHLRSCAVGLVKQVNTPQVLEEANVARSDDPVAQRIIDKSALAISKPKRIRCQGSSPLRCEPTLRHLRTITLSRSPCAICATTRIGHQGQR
jgi:hypothetical protein